MWRGRGVSATLTLFDNEDSAVIKKYAIGLLAACAAVMSHADVMWGKAAAGDSLEAVKAAHPGGQEVPPDEKNVVARTGAMLLYKVSGIEINENKYTASFSFINDGLAQVTLNSRPTIGEQQCFSSFRQVVEAMKSKYGEALSVDFSSSVLKTALFQRGNVSARVDAMAGSKDCALSIYYTTKLSEAAKNL